MFHVLNVCFRVDQYFMTLKGNQIGLAAAITEEMFLCSAVCMYVFNWQAHSSPV